jgi:molybdenum cofactor biosynthesis protein B
LARATAGVAGATYIFCLPGSPVACNDGWDDILVRQLDYRYRPCNFVEIVARLDEHCGARRRRGRRFRAVPGISPTLPWPDLSRPPA